MRQARLLSVIKINQLALTDRRSQATLTIPRKRLTQASLRPHQSQDWEDYSEGSSRYFTQSCQAITLDDFIFEFKNQSILKCCLCGIDKKEKYKFHVDHIVPFSKIRNDFLDFTSFKKPDKFLNCSKENKNMFTEEDEWFKNDWIMYHNETCKLQILCDQCNIKKSNH